MRGDRTERSDRGSSDVAAVLEEVYRLESRRVFATLIRLLGDFDLAEDALQEAFAAAVEKWSSDGIPKNPRAWLVSTGRFKAIDRLRRRKRFDKAVEEIALEAECPVQQEKEEGEFGDDRLRLIFTCCHPALSPEARIALTLREVCGLTTEEIARAFLTSAPTLAQRIVRAKRKIRNARIPYEIPPRAELTERLDSVLHVIYLVFNEGYSASAGEAVTRPDLSGEAIHLARMLLELLSEPEVMGLLALMLIQESRRTARTTPDGDLVLLSDQDRSTWDRDLIDEGLSLVDEAMRHEIIGPFTIQAAIAAVHARAGTLEETDWGEIVALYDVLLRIQGSPVVELNRAVAVSMRDGPRNGLALVDAILDRGELADYHLAHAVRADLARRLGRIAEARSAYERALSLAEQEPERRFLTRRLHDLDGT